MNMHINTISDISEVNMEYTVDCYFRQEWYDPRLMYSNSSWKHVEDITLHYDLVNKVWTPDAFFRNSKDAKSHMITVPNRLIRIFPEGRVLFSQRYVKFYFKKKTRNLKLAVLGFEKISKNMVLSVFILNSRCEP
jgi:hypothetical protein